jgi:hypothetical protein
MECTGPLIYHPQRYREMRPFFQSLYRVFRNGCTPEGMPLASGMIATQQKMIELWNEELDRLPFDDRPTSMKRLNEEISIFSHVASCFFAGRNIFHLQPALTSLLRDTDVDEIEWRAIHLPYPCFYVWFGKQKDWPLDIAHYVDGAYIESTGGRGIQITLTSMADVYPEWQNQNFVLDFDPYYYASFRFESNSTTTVGQTLAEMIENDPSFHPDKEPGISDMQAADLRSQGINVESKPYEESARYEALLEHQASLPVFLRALRLVINGLCFLSAEPDDIVTAFPKEALGLLGEPSENGKAARELGQNEVRKLRRLGYSEIHFCGNKFVEAGEHHAATGTGGEMPPHRRRAFWRNQACGAGLTERRPTWVRPTIVRKDRLKEGEDALGHMYIVEPRQ